ncbi:hypothetical protein CRUP_031885 [Coryphaenoides rupestris]|nr:hypothetical protein CRUP_031885 [Coryphaenoides rupestris]
MVVVVVGEVVVVVVVGVVVVVVEVVIVLEVVEAVVMMVLDLVKVVVVMMVVEVVVVMMVLEATDPDKGQNGEVRYRIVNHPDLFTVTADGGIFTSAPLDREQVSLYELIVEASDGAVDPRRTAHTLTVQVEDIDDNSPEFSRQVYVVNVPENSPVGTVVLQLSARDADLVSNVTYHITTASALLLFSVDAVTGNVSMLQTLDFEDLTALGTGTSYTFQVEAVDQGGVMPPGQATVTVRITPQPNKKTRHFEIGCCCCSNGGGGGGGGGGNNNIDMGDTFRGFKDVNDFAPIFSQDLYKGLVAPNADKGSPIATVFAEDQDPPVSVAHGPFNRWPS